MRELIHALFIAEADYCAKDFPYAPRFLHNFDKTKSAFAPVCEINDGRVLFLGNLDKDDIEVVSSDPGVSDFCAGNLGSMFFCASKTVRELFYQFRVKRISPITGTTFEYMLSLGEISSGDEVLDGPHLSHVFAGADIVWEGRDRILEIARARSQPHPATFEVSPAAYAFCYGVPFVAHRPTEIVGLPGVWWLPPASIPRTAFAYVSPEIEEQYGYVPISGALVIDLTKSKSRELLSNYKYISKFSLKLRNVMSAFLTALLCTVHCRPKIFGITVTLGHDNSAIGHSYFDMSPIEPVTERLRQRHVAAPRPYALSPVKISQLLRLAHARSAQNPDLKVDNWAQSLRYSGMAFTNPDNKIFVLLIWAAIEQIIFTESNSGEIGNKLSLALSALYPAEQRADAFNKTKKCYAMRSKIAHGVYFSEDPDFLSCLQFSTDIYKKIIRLGMNSEGQGGATRSLSYEHLVKHVLSGEQQPFSLG